MTRLFEVSERYFKSPGNYPMGVVVVHDLNKASAAKRLEVAKEFALARMVSERHLLEAKISRYEQYFSAGDVICPLPAQFERVLADGFPRLNRFVEAMFVVEMSTGILMGAQDFDQMQGKLLFDLVERTESYEGMRGWINCRKGSVVVRDSLGIIASLFDGSDLRTKITSQTRNALFFAFGVPSVAADELGEALDQVWGILGPCAERASRQLYE